MITRVHMEALSPTMEEGQLVRWLKAEGDEVTSGDILARDLQDHDTTIRYLNEYLYSPPAPHGE